MRSTSLPPSSRILGILCRLPAKATILLTTACIVFVQTQSRAGEVESHPGISLEPMYSEAVIAYNSKQPNQALKVLDEVLKIKPDYVQALELKALVLKSMGKPEESRANYEALIKSSPKEKAAPYHFELGVIQYNAKHPEEAAPHFEEAIAHSFNLDASHFFLGLINFNLANKPGKLGESEKHFLAVADGSSDELKPAAHYYIGLIRYKNGAGSEGTYELIEARSIARSMLDNPLAKDIDQAVGVALAPYGKSQWFGNASILEAFNGNVASLTPEQPASQKQTFQTLVTAGLGRMSSPLETIQWVASYRGNFNYNTNSDTSTYQFLTHALDLYLTRNPLARTQYGFKFEGNFNFQDKTDISTGSSAFTWYSVTGEFGPYLRRQLSRGVQLSLEAYYHPQKFYGEDGDYDQTGSGGVFRTSLQFERGSTWWNPTVMAAIEKNRTNGAVYRDWGADLSLSDLMRIGSNNMVTAAAALNFFQYQESDPQRFDKYLSLRVDWVHTLATHWTVIGDVGYTINYSNQPEKYYYTQPLVSAGVSYNF